MTLEQATSVSKLFFLPLLYKYVNFNNFILFIIFLCRQKYKKMPPQNVSHVNFFFSFGQNYRIYKNTCRLPPPTMCRPVRTAPTAPPLGTPLTLPYMFGQVFRTVPVITISNRSVDSTNINNSEPFTNSPLRQTSI